MSPEEHYQRGLDLIDAAERANTSGAPSYAQTYAVLAQSHFGAAAAGAAMQAWAAMQSPQLIRPADDVPVGGTDG